MWHLSRCDDVDCAYGALPMWIFVDPGYPPGHYEPNPDYVEAMCINWDEMNYYLANAEATVENETPLDKAFIHYRMWRGILTSNDHPFWIGEAKYAKKNIDKLRALYELPICN